MHSHQLPKFYGAPWIRTRPSGSQPTKSTSLAGPGGSRGIDSFASGFGGGWLLGGGWLAGHGSYFGHVLGDVKLALAPVIIHVPDLRPFTHTQEMMKISEPQAK